MVALQTAQAAYEAASQSREYQAQLLDAERDKLSVGQSTDLAVLQNEGVPGAGEVDGDCGAFELDEGADQPGLCAGGFVGEEPRRAGGCDQGDAAVGGGGGEADSFATLRNDSQNGKGNSKGKSKGNSKGKSKGNSKGKSKGNSKGKGKSKGKSKSKGKGNSKGSRRIRLLGAGVLVILHAVVEVVEGAGFHLGVGVGLGHALAVELEPDHAAVNVCEVAVLLIGVEGKELLQVLVGRGVAGGSIVAKGGGVVEGGPGGSVDTGLVDEDGRGGVGDRVAVVAAVANHVEDEEAENDGEQDVVAGRSCIGRV